MTTRRAKYATAIRPRPDRSAPIIARTTPGKVYEIQSTRLVGGFMWHKIAGGWVRNQVNGVETFR